MIRWGAKLIGLKVSDTTSKRNSGWKYCENTVRMITDDIKTNYEKYLLPLENLNGFHYFHTPKLDDTYFYGRPSVLLVGKYSAGKTTLIKDILGCEYPGMRIGPEPTTDCFNAVMYGESESIIPGHAAVADHTMPFHYLTEFGGNFLSNFQCSTLKHEVTQTITFIDTPGISSIDKDQEYGGYDVLKVFQTFSEKVDKIIVMFDAHNVEVTDDLRNYLQGLGKHGEKVRIVLNKADSLPYNELVRVYGALMWSLSKILQLRETPRVFVGSFWSNPITDIGFFETEKGNLLDDLRLLPYTNIKGKLFDLCRRTEVAKVHAYLTSHLKSKLPFLGKYRAKKKLIENLRNVYVDVEMKYHVYFGCFPEISTMQQLLSKYNWDKFKTVDNTLIANAKEFLKYISDILMRIPDESIRKNSRIASRPDGDKVKPPDTMDRPRFN